MLCTAGPNVIVRACSLVLEFRSYILSALNRHITSSELQLMLSHLPYQASTPFLVLHCLLLFEDPDDAARYLIREILPKHSLFKLHMKYVKHDHFDSSQYRDPFYSGVYSK